jgi:hypothetical protein
MITLQITKTRDGFNVTETKEVYTFQPYIIDEAGTEVQNQVLNSTTALVGTDKGVILLNTDCSIDAVTYTTIEEFLTALYAV